MNTFIPYSDFNKVAKCLDNKRLGKQRVEAWQIYLTLQKIKKQENIQSKIKDFNGALSVKGMGWANHPIVKMWKGHELSLIDYGLNMCAEWIERGFKDTLREKFLNELPKHYWYDEGGNLIIGNKEVYYPDWCYDEELLLSHQSNLVRKFPEHYRKYFPNIRDDLPYKWVVE